MSLTERGGVVSPCYVLEQTMSHVPKELYDKVVAENHKLRDALANAIPWIGDPGYGPSWATEKAKQRNKEMCDNAFDRACECFPEDFDSGRDLAERN